MMYYTIFMLHLNDKKVYARILIKHKKDSKDED